MFRNHRADPRGGAHRVVWGVPARSPVL